jgi:hypothetical protein
VARKPIPKFIIPGLDGMRADIGITPNKLAGAAGCSLATTQAALREVPLSRNVCERLINALKRLGNFGADHSQITPVRAPVDDAD